jgi:hypothetical protein
LSVRSDIIVLHSVSPGGGVQDCGFYGSSTNGRGVIILSRFWLPAGRSEPASHADD